MLEAYPSRLTLPARRPTIGAMAPDDRDPPNDDLDPRERARVHRRDHDAHAEARDLMRPGMGKVFKQIQDAQAKAARTPPKRRRRPA
jgi:hypothetical protein